MQIIKNNPLADLHIKSDSTFGVFFVYKKRQIAGFSYGETESFPDIEAARAACIEYLGKRSDIADLRVAFISRRYLQDRKDREAEPTSEPTPDPRRVNFISVLVVVKPGIINTRSKVETKELRILGERNEIICLDDDYFPTVSLKSEKDLVRSNIEKPSIRFDIDCRIWGTAITYRLFSFRKVRLSTVKRQIEEARREKFGDLFSVDLSFLDKEVE